MIVEKHKEEERHQLLMAAFNDSTFQQELDAVRLELEKWLWEWASQREPFDRRIKNIYSVESRIKGSKTFEEKLYRKNYIKEWEVSYDIKENQKFIMQTLTDLIGLRVNCHFVEYEKLFYEFFRDSSESQKVKEFEFNFNENIEQKNGNKIYKFSGLFKNTYHFEVQIKSIVHNVWGEVEHRTVYKNPTYDGFFEEKKKISQTLHDAMMASDHELLVLFNMRESENQLLRSLFFCKTNEEVAKNCKTRVLGEHYNSYFLSFPDIKPIVNYLVCSLSGTEYHKPAIKVESDEYYNKLSNAVSDTFPRFFIECLFNIDSILYQYESYEAFLIHFLQMVVPNTEEDFDNDFSADFNGQDEGNASDNPNRDALVKIDEILGTRIFKKDKK